MKCIRCDSSGASNDYKVCVTCIKSLLDEADKPKPILNHLLCYISTYFSSSSSAKIQVACLRAFTDAEVYAARDLLFLAYPNQLGPIQKRQDSPSKTRVQAVMEDILKAFKDLDKIKIQPLSRYSKTYTRKKVILCIFCDYYGLSEMCFNWHLKIHTNEKPSLRNKCDCNGLTEVCFNWHLEIHTGEKTYLCIICYYGGNNKLECFGIRLAFLIFNIDDG